LGKEIEMKPVGLVRGAFSLVELLAVIAIIAILIALLVPAVQKVRAAAVTAECVNNMKQIGLGLQLHYDVHRCFPTPKRHMTSDPATSPGWMYAILPYIGQEALYEQGQSRDGSLRGQTWMTIVPTYLCPSDQRDSAGGIWDGPEKPDDYAMTSYLGLVGKTFIADWDGVFGGDVGIKVSQITDGLSNTLMVGERPPSPDRWVGWWASNIADNCLWAIGGPWPFKYSGDSGESCPASAYFSPGDIISYCHADHFWSFHSGGGNWLLCDGSVRFMDYSAGVTVIPNMARISGKEVISLE
jgi:prepilin-type N-terminal cleavage/methylation domain-containing protein/prepilin-type processing-associated H-X9-DG protein